MIFCGNAGRVPCLGPCVVGFLKIRSNSSAQAVRVTGRVSGAGRAMINDVSRHPDTLIQWYTREERLVIETIDLYVWS